MAYVEPTYDDFIARYPAFASADEYLVHLVLDEAIVQVDDSWIERDRSKAQLLLTAHMLTIETAPSVNKSGPVTSESFGPMSRSYAVGSGGGSAGSFDGSEYGRQFKALQRRNFPGVVVAG